MLLFQCACWISLPPITWCSKQSITQNFRTTLQCPALLDIKYRAYQTPMSAKVLHAMKMAHSTHLLLANQKVQQVFQIHKQRCIGFRMFLLCFCIWEVFLFKCVICTSWWNPISIVLKYLHFCLSFPSSIRSVRSSVCLSLPVCLSFCQFVDPSVCMYMYVCLYFCFLTMTYCCSLCLSQCQSTQPSTRRLATYVPPFLQEQLHTYIPISLLLSQLLKVTRARFRH